MEPCTPVSVVEQQLPTIVLSFPTVGPQGPPGASGVSECIKAAGETLSGHRIVYLAPDFKVYYANHSILSQVLCVIGVTTESCVKDSVVTLKVFGEIEEPSWNWELDKCIFLGENGMLTQLTPTDGVILRVGFPLSTTSLFIKFSEPVIL